MTVSFSDLVIKLHTREYEIRIQFNKKGHIRLCKLYLQNRCQLYNIVLNCNCSFYFCSLLLLQIMSLAGIPQTALYMSKVQFYSCLKLIAAYQSSVPLRKELIASTIALPLPKFSWKESPVPLKADLLNGSLTFRCLWCLCVCVLSSYRI